jgi:AAA15 family ATPase/GTPase
LVSGNRDGQYSPYTAFKLQDPASKARILDFTKFADLGIGDIQLVQEAVADMNVKEIDGRKEMALKKLFVEKNSNSLFSFHQKFDKELNEKELVQFLFSQSESEGTIKYFGLAGPIIDTLDNGKILVIDELDSKLHPLLTQKIISLFNSIETNPKNAQLVFTTHDTNLLSANIFRRDQIWFAQKDRYGASTLYSLAEYIIPVRNDASFEKDYLAGKYGAVPSFKNFKKLFNSKTVLKNG